MNIISPVTSPSIYFGLSKRKIKDIKKAGGIEKYEMKQKEKQTKRKNNFEETQANKRMRIENNLTYISNLTQTQLQNKNKIKVKPIKNNNKKNKKTLSTYDYIKSKNYLFSSKQAYFTNVVF